MIDKPTTPDCPPSLRISVSNYFFQITAPYNAGQTYLTEEEARAFNTLRAENIRNRVAAKVRQAVQDSPSGELSPEAIADLQSIISEVDSTYQFPARQRAPKLTALDIEVEIVAAEMADSAARQAGQMSAPQEMVEDWKRKSEVQAEARRRLAEQKLILKGEEL